MPKIPDENQLTRAIPSARREISTSRAGVAVGRAVTGAAEKVGHAITARMDRQDRFAYATAKSEFLKADAEVRRELEDDEDYESWEPKYRERMAGHLQSIGGSLRNVNDAGIFQTDGELGIERGANATHKLAFDRDIRVKRATLDGILANNRTIIMEEQDEGVRQGIITNTLDAINAAVADRYLTPEEGEAKRRGWTTDYAKGYITVQDDETAIAILSDKNHPVARFLDADERKTILEARQQSGRENSIREEGQQIFMEETAKGGTQPEIIARINKRKVPKVDGGAKMDSAKSRVRTHFNDLDAQRNRVEHETYQGVYDDLFVNKDGAGHPLRDIDDITPEEHTHLTAAQTENLRKLWETKEQPKETTSEGWEDYTRLMLLRATNIPELAEEDPMDYRGKLNDTMYSTVVDAITAARTGKPMSNANRGDVTHWLKVAMRTDDNDFLYTQKGQRVQQEFLERIEDEQRFRKEKNPKDYKLSQLEMKKMAEDLLVQTTLPGTGRDFGPFGEDVFATQKRAYELEISDIPPAEEAEIREFFRTPKAEDGGGLKREPTENEITDMYARLILYAELDTAEKRRRRREARDKIPRPALPTRTEAR